MAFVTPRMSLKVWNSASDPYDHEQLADNFLRLDQHDHSPGRGTPIGGDGIRDGAITAAHIFPGAITVDLIADDSIPSTALVDGAVTTPKLASGAVTNTKLANDAVTNIKILNSTIAANKLAGGILKTQLDTTALNAFLKLAAAGDFLVKFGVSATGSFGGGARLQWTISHGLGRTPIIGFAQAGVLQTFGDAGNVPLVGGVNILNGTSIGASFDTANADGTSQSAPVYWLVIG